VHILMAYDVTLVNMNLMYAVIDHRVDFQVYNPLGLLSVASCLRRKDTGSTSGTTSCSLSRIWVTLSTLRPSPDCGRGCRRGRFQLHGQSPSLHFAGCQAIEGRQAGDRGRPWRRGPDRRSPQNHGELPWIDYVCYGEENCPWWIWSIISSQRLATPKRSPNRCPDSLLAWPRT